MALSLFPPAFAADSYSLARAEKESGSPYTPGDLAAARLAVYGVLPGRFRVPQAETAWTLSYADAVRLLHAVFADSNESPEPDDESRAITETEFISMLLDVLGYREFYADPDTLSFANAIGLAPLGVSAATFTLGDAALYLQCASKLYAADGTPVRERMNIPDNIRQTTFPDTVILTPTSPEDAETLLREATRYLPTNVIINGDFLTKDELFTIFKTYYRVKPDRTWYASRIYDGEPVKVAMNLSNPDALSQQERDAYYAVMTRLWEQHESGEISIQEYGERYDLEEARLLCDGTGLTLKFRYCEAWELVCDLDDAFTLYRDDALTRAADAFYQKYVAKARNDREAVKLAEDAVIRWAEYAEPERYDQNGEAVYAPETHSILGFFQNRQIVCDGYANIFQYLTLRAGVDCVAVCGFTEYGGAKKSEKICHYWNKVRLDGVWLNVDVCWSDTGAPYMYDLRDNDFYERRWHWAVTFTDL